jgi:IS5 family transposase
VPDQTTVCKFRQPLEENHLGKEILGTVNLHLQAKGVRLGGNSGATSAERAFLSRLSVT